jgi:heme A synthase
MNAKTYGLMAEFDSPGAVLYAAEKVRDAGYRRWDVFTPFPIHGLDKVMGYRNSHVGWVSLAFGAGAFFSVVFLIWYCNTYDYPLIVGGKPMFSAPMTFVPAYILLILGAAVGALVGMLGLNQLPRLHHPLLAKKRFDLVTRDKFVIVIGANDEKFGGEETRQLLQSVGGTHIETVEEPE